ncbi:hypothetical protein CNMCM8980_001117 [Aspergillus fumigatiaffinis]|jgi:hypothetical protein|uniref:Uncharacterized protein n=1 Tax=Aspergillus fumigatiaffinis TaxID=340414 RepID=A0A8H4GLQ1_9EURO|nr:hypothetical protein CNMCM5878_003491 [Aspergillus fumigatiaffinis]KAF4224354.1 hypothetical protein CNMCM6457_009479 [Aspergillus fumigatiaffinis]KAF4233069.1 hypothetical protein CNMCM6805_009554 [Aspergillus fumigatiaffinis]KAF4240748.1 hypothetical protein CNMCM8980_001117 [Aspergillus fumigatiaffinis]
MAKELSKGCVACGWTSELQERCSYSSHVKLFYGADRRGTWSIGSDVILKERPDEGPKTEDTTLSYLASIPNVNIPAPKVLRDWVTPTRDALYLSRGCTGRHLSRPGLRCQNARKRPSQLRSLKFASDYNPSHQKLYRVLTEALVTRGCFSLIASPMDLSTLTLNSGML